MNLYCIDPGCALVPHISAREAAIPADPVRVDPKTQQAATG
jgi:hypothetical protein